MLITTVNEFSHSVLFIVLGKPVHSLHAMDVVCELRVTCVCNYCCLGVVDFLSSCFLMVWLRGDILLLGT